MPNSLNSLPLFTTNRRGASAEGDELRSCAGSGVPLVDIVRPFIRLANDRWSRFVVALLTSSMSSGQHGNVQAHSIHEISYRACFKPQLPAFFISHLTEPNELVYDPFMGRGTTPVQAALMDRRPAGNDINPLSVLLTRPRLRPVLLSDIMRVLDTVDWKTGSLDEPDLLAFYRTYVSSDFGAEAMAVRKRTTG